MTELLCVNVPETVKAALKVIAGMYGNGADRKKKLEADGLNYSKVQNCVNELVKLLEKYGG